MESEILVESLSTYSMEQSPSWEANQWALQLVKKLPAFMEPESSSPYPQVPATCPYPEPIPSSPLHNEEVFGVHVCRQHFQYIGLPIPEARLFYVNM
jgi:hypothetical protein